MDTITDFLRQPFKRNMNALDWGLFIGLVIVSIILWSGVTNSIVSNIGE